MRRVCTRGGGICRAAWAAILVTAVGACAAATRVETPGARADVPLHEFWIDPGNPRDLFWGVGGKRYAPSADAIYEFEARDETGFSVSYDVVGADGVEWSAKIGPEAQTEVAVSRILWGLGYHQPPLYYLPAWKLDRGEGEPRLESEARFRPKLPQLKRLDEYWKWTENPFVGTREYRGLLVVLMMLNSTDLKDDNNSIYELGEPWEGASRWFVVRDLGAALGETGKLFPRRNWLEGFEREGFIKRVRGDRVEFDYGGRHKELFGSISTDDVRWAALRMRRLTDEQWRDAFRSANYAEPTADRFIRRIRQKIDDGLALRADGSVTEDR